MQTEFSNAWCPAARDAKAPLLNPDIFFVHWCHKLGSSSVKWIFKTVRANREMRIQKHPNTCGWGTLLRLYFNVNGRRTRAGHKAPGFEPSIQFLPTPMIISFHSVSVIFIHRVEKLIVGRFWHTLVQPNVKLIFVPQVVIWNGKHDSKCWSVVLDVVCQYSFYATWPVPRSFSCAVSQGFT